jgi:signal transduction histidine kinase
MWLILTPSYLSDVSLWIIVFGSLMCLAPLLRLPGSASYDSFDDESSSNITNSLLTSQFYRESLTAGLFIVVIPTADLCVELSQNLFVLLTTRNSEDRVFSKVVRLTNLERILFITGVIIRSAAILVPVHDKILQLVFDCTNNSSTILMTCPVMVFFGRCTTTWTPSLTIFTISLTVVSNILETSSFFFEPQTIMCTNLLTSSQILVILAVVMVFSLTFLCLYKFVRIKIGPRLRESCATSKRTFPIDDAAESKNDTEAVKNIESDKKPLPVVVIDELYENYVPGAHMFIAVVVASTYVMSTILRKAYPSLTSTIGGYENVVVLISAVTVLIVEYRIRGNEITRGLVSQVNIQHCIILFQLRYSFPSLYIFQLLLSSLLTFFFPQIREKEGLSLLLDSKKSYVRYISHELRTPLNTTFLGMRLLSKDFNLSDDPRDRVRFETLTDMSLSCTAALDILNDLLCFEKLESGILDLHKQEVQVMPFLQDCMNMFAVQAKEGAVTMSVDTEFNSSDYDLHRNSEDLEPDSTSGYGKSRSFLSLEDSDVVMIDKFKMDQVIRNLISNALKFTPRGGSISVKVTFIPNTPTSSSENSSGYRKLGLIRQESYWSKSISSLYGRRGRGRGRRIFPDFSTVTGDWDNLDPETGAGAPLSGRFESNLGSNDSSMPTLIGKLVIVVHDSGAGISATNQKRLFKEIVQFQPEILQVPYVPLYPTDKRPVIFLYL